MMKRNYVFVLIISFLLLATLLMSSYAVFETNVHGPVEMDLANWQILVNSTDISGGSQSFNVEQVNWDRVSYVVDGKAAPGLGAYFEIIIDPTGTDVAVGYELNFDMDSLSNDYIYITSVTSNGEPMDVLDNTFIGNISLEDVQTGSEDVVRVEIFWENNESNDLVDSNFVNQETPQIVIPTSIRVFQQIE